MEIKEAVVAALKEIIFPELQGLKHGQAELRASLDGIHKRLDDHNAYLVDLNRRVDKQGSSMDELRAEVTNRIDKVQTEVNVRINKLETVFTTRIDKVETELNTRLDKIETDHNNRSDKLESVFTTRIDKVETEHNNRFDKLETELTTRIDQVRSELTTRLDKLYGDLIARNDETNRAVARLYEVIVRRDELGVILDRVARVEWEVEEIKKKLAA
ncbi:MAG: hypothetical protein PHW74_11455 [Desulfobacca sp.]|nr:hypothetical protein [Desulfobacca sp.]